MWFVSLAFGLATALLSVLVKQWIQAYMAPTFGTPHSQSRVRHFRYMGIQQWHVPLIAGLLPILLHIALLLFFIGLVVFLFTIDHVIAGFVTLVGVLAYSAYMIANILPAFFPQCPYRTPLSTYAYFAVRKMRPTLSRCYSQLRKVLRPLVEQVARMYGLAHQGFRQLASGLSKLSHMYLPAKPYKRKYRPRSNKPDDSTLQATEKSAIESDGDLLDAEMLTWLCEMSANPSVRTVVVTAASDLPIGFTALSTIRNGVLPYACAEVMESVGSGSVIPGMEKKFYVALHTHMQLGPEKVFGTRAPYSGAPTSDYEEKMVSCRCHWHHYGTEMPDLLAREQRLTVLRFLPSSDYHNKSVSYVGLGPDDSRQTPTANDLRVLCHLATSERVWILLLRHALRSLLDNKTSTFDIQRGQDVTALSLLLRELVDYGGNSVFNTLQTVLLGAYLFHWTLPSQIPFQHPVLLKAVLIHEEKLLHHIYRHDTGNCKDHYLVHIRIHILVHCARACPSGMSIYVYAKENLDNFKMLDQTNRYFGDWSATLAEDHPLLEQLHYLIPTPDDVRYILDSDSADRANVVVQMGEAISTLCVFLTRRINNEVLYDTLKENDLIGVFSLLIEPPIDNMHGSQLNTTVISQVWQKVDTTILFLVRALSSSINAKAHLGYILAHLPRLCRWAFACGAYTLEEDPPAHTENVGEPGARRSERRRSNCIHEVGEYMAKHMSHTEYLARWDEVTKEVSGFLLEQGHSERVVELFAQDLNNDFSTGWKVAQGWKRLGNPLPPEDSEHDAVVKIGLLSSAWSKIRSVIPSSKRTIEDVRDTYTSPLPSTTDNTQASASSLSSIPQTGPEAV